MKPLAIRISEEQHVRLNLLAKVCGTNATDLARTAITEHIETLAADTDLAAKAEQLLEEHDRQAKAERDALAALLSTGTPPVKTARGRKPETA